jgi:spore germination protein
MTPFISFVENKRDLKDTLIRPRIRKLVRKPDYLHMEKEEKKNV